MTHEEACHLASLLEALQQGVTAETKQRGPNDWSVVVYDDERPSLSIAQAEVDAPATTGRDAHDAAWPAQGATCPLCNERDEVAAALHNALLGFLCVVAPQEFPQEVKHAERARNAYLRYAERRLAIIRAQNTRTH